ncbi:MAG: type II toxin-antitoxin system HicA family toxin [Acidobacteria bacterium]|nr:type II toxin-antitoxin system HicA family toxin [Acidobacteriota bacterium]
MTRLPRLKAKELLRALRRTGFQLVRTRGSHVYVKHPDGRATVVPVHSGETLGPGILASILRDLEMSNEDLVKLL